MNESIKDEIRALLNDLESDRVERTISTTNTDKFGQAICAFANDLPNHQMPGFLFLGVLDNGEIQGVDATDELLKNVDFYKKFSIFLGKMVLVAENLY